MLGAGLAMLVSAGSILVAARLAHGSVVAAPVDVDAALPVSH
jgi:hypothetical protein